MADQNTTELVRLHAVVEGRVQGVNFRYYTTRTAQRLGLQGWVANRWDGSVECVAEGTQTRLKDLLAFLKTGPPSAFVTRVDARWEPASGEFDEFRVRYL
jgi:acylphosphatase